MRIIDTSNAKKTTNLPKKKTGIHRFHVMQRKEAKVQMSRPGKLIPKTKVEHNIPEILKYRQKQSTLDLQKMQKKQIEYQRIAEIERRMGIGFRQVLGIAAR